VPLDDYRPPTEREWAPPQPSPRRRRALTGWQVAGIVCAVVLAVCGLAVVAGGVLFMVALNQWGSNK
jgi:hypothetical protein